jgi:hypothetical protein
MKKPALSIWTISLIMSAGSCWPSFLPGQPPDSLWMTNLGGDQHEIGFGVTEGPPGVYYAVGKTNSAGNGDYDGYLVKLNSDGSVAWEKTFGGPMTDGLSSICPSWSGGYILTGIIGTGIHGSSDVWIMEVNPEGDSLWSRMYGGSHGDRGIRVRQTTDGGYILAASRYVLLQGDQVYLLRLDAAGDTLWTKTYGGSHHDYSNDILQTADGGFIVAGVTYTDSGIEAGQAYAMKTDASGDTLWTRKYGGGHEDIFNSVAETPTGYIFAGNTWSFGAGLLDIYAVGTDLNGHIIWEETYGHEGAELSYAICPAVGGNYVIAGYTNSFREDYQVYLIQIGPDGDMTWEEHYGPAVDYELTYGAGSTSDGGFLITGKMDYYWELYDDMFMLKLGPSSSGIPAPACGNLSFSSTPNPFHGNTAFSFHFPSPACARLLIYDLLGNVRAVIDLGQVPAGGLTKKWDASLLAPGIYLSRLEAGCEVAVKKLVVRE